MKWVVPEMLKFKVHADGLNELAWKLAQSCSKAEHIAAEQVRKDTSPYVPALTGSLDNRTQVADGQVIYPGPYARYLYYGKLMVDPETGSSYAKAGSTKVLTDKDLVFNQATHAQAQSHWFEASKAQNLGKWERVMEKAVKREIK